MKGQEGVSGEGMIILNNREEISFFFFFPLSFVSFRSVTFARLHAVFGHGGGGGNDIVFCGLKTFGAHFCKRLKIDDLGFLFMQLSQLVPSYDAPVLFCFECLSM